MNVQLACSFLSTLFALALASNATCAEPVRLLPKSAETLYLARSYSKTHLAAHPDQIVERIVVEIYHEGGDSTPGIYIRVLKKGENRPVYSAGGLFEEEGRALRFFLEGDAGKGILEPGDGCVLLKLRGKDFMTLSTADQRYNQGFDTEKLLTLEASDPEHRTFKLYPSTRRESVF